MQIQTMNEEQMNEYAWGRTTLKRDGKTCLTKKPSIYVYILKT